MMLATHGPAHRTQISVDVEASWLTPQEPNLALKARVRSLDNESSQPARGSAKRKHATGKIGKNSSASGGSAGLRFFVVDHPDQLKDKKQMRRNRQHVMHTYLDKEAMKPDSKDSRVRKHSSRQAHDSDSRSTTLTTSVSSNGDTSRLTPVDSRSSSNISRDLYYNEDNRKSMQQKMRRSSPGTLPGDGKRSNVSIIDEQPLVDGMGGRFDTSDYMRATPGEIPFSLSSQQIGGVDRFNTWPSFNDPTLDLDELKFNCTQRFGSSKLTMHWIPTLLKARHAFLSTLCLSSAHDDIMRRNMLPHDHRTTESLMKRLQVRQSVIEMINESMNDPDMRIADETIVAVLHVLHSEVMGCDDRTMRIHQIGLHEMVRERGGLRKLGVGGQLAPVLTICMFLLAALRETVPHNDFLDYATEQNTSIPETVSRMPESPLYCRPTGFERLNKLLTPEDDNETLMLLQTARELTREFRVESTAYTSRIYHSTGRRCSPAKPSKTITRLCQKVFSAQPGWELNFNDMNERYIYESVRLVTIVYAHAISRRKSLSKAATELRDCKTRPAAVILPNYHTALPILIKNAIMRTDISSCWDHLMGVLFWVTLVAGATANPGPLANYEREGDDEDARKWITAIAVRVSIVLSFEYGTAVLETLKRTVAVESLLRSEDDDSEEDATVTWTEIDLERCKSGPADSSSQVGGGAATSKAEGYGFDLYAAP